MFALFRTGPWKWRKKRGKRGWTPDEVANTWNARYEGPLKPIAIKGYCSWSMLASQKTNRPATRNRCPSTFLFFLKVACSNTYQYPTPNPQLLIPYRRLPPGLIFWDLAHMIPFLALICSSQKRKRPLRLMLFVSHHVWCFPLFSCLFFYFCFFMSN